MAHIIEFSQYAEQPDPETMSREELLDFLASIRLQIEELDQQEPEDMMSEEYEDWGGRHEELEDLADEIRDLLDERDG